MNVTLSLASSPPRIHSASSKWLDEFGFELHFCRNRTLNLVVGPDTDAGALARLITTVEHGKQAQATLVLYSRAGTGTLFHVRAQLSSSGARMELAMLYCDVVSMLEAGREDGSVKVLLEAKKPFRVVHVSSAFVAAYGFEPERITNRTLSMIQGPSTDLNVWKEMIHGALSGWAQEAHIQTYTCNGSEAEGLTHVRVTPVMGTGDIGHLLIAMDHGKSSGMYKSGDFQRHEGSVCTQRADQNLSDLNGSVRRLIEELRAEQYQSKSAKTPISVLSRPKHSSNFASERATHGVHSPSRLPKGVPGTPHCMKVEPLPVRSSEAAAKRQSFTGGFTMKILRESNAAKRVQQQDKTIRNMEQIYNRPDSEASCFSLIMNMVMSLLNKVMTLLYCLSAGRVFPSMARLQKRRTSVYERIWEPLHFDGIHYHL